MSLDLDALKARVLRPEHGGFMPDLCLIGRTDLAALVAEVERLREFQNNALHAGTDEVAEERALVVAFLREYAVPRKIDPDVLVLLPPGATVVSHFADAIERGEHRREEEK